MEQRKTWQQPWQYAESIAVVIGLAIVGFALQLFSGKFNFLLISSPVNLIIGGIIVLISILAGIKRKTAFCQWFTGVPLAVSLLGGLLVLSIFMGLTPQMENIDPHHRNLAVLLGFRQMTSSWAFVILYTVTLLSLGGLIVRRLINFKVKDYVFYLMHTGLWVLLFAAGLGAADLRRYVMFVNEGETEWRVFNQNEKPLELPLAIQLNDFQMEEYPPKLTVIDRLTGEAQPKEKPQYVQIDEKVMSGKLLDYDIVIDKYIQNAVRNSDSSYTEVSMPGATPAALVRVRNLKDNTEKNGWICGGSVAQLYMMLPLTEKLAMVMTQAEPKRFVSDINVYTEDEKSVSALLEVNKPLKIGSWMIYQYGYDTNLGKASPYSSFELVYDPWKGLVYIGILLFAVGSLFLIIKKN
ncbi:MAG: cytochrome c biogenesis protein ResB [Tannerella sp.]|jgi:hypothetical protein|nr:cytochrome c biogenesis protein ResB [Tannerella sp.]